MKILLVAGPGQAIIRQNDVPFPRTLGHVGITTTKKDLVRGLATEVAEEIKTVSIHRRNARKSVEYKDLKPLKSM